MGISAVVVCYNEEKHIEDCLRSLHWVQEIIVVDSFSTDRTVEIARRYTDRVIQRKWQGYSDQKNFGIEQAGEDWVISVDSDERVTPQLRVEIERVMLQSDITGYYLPRANFFLGQWMKHSGWYPDYQLRLFRQGAARYNSKLVHERLELNGVAGHLAQPLTHITYENLDQYLRKFNDYTTLEAKALAQNKRGLKWSLRNIPGSSVLYFIHKFIFRGGFLDGYYGFVLSVLSSVYIFVMYAKLREHLKGKT